MKNFWDDKKNDPQFHKKYAKAQEDLNTSKFNCVWCKQPEIDCISKYLLDRGTVSFGLCHGSRNGSEVRMFRDLLGCQDIIGTDIAASANSVKEMEQWDFHEKNPKWEGKADFVYTNSFDHAYDLDKALDAWMHSLKNDGVCLLHSGPGHESLDDNPIKKKITAGDCSEYSQAGLIDCVTKKYTLVEIFDTGFRDRHVYVISK